MGLVAAVLAGTQVWPAPVAATGEAAGGAFSFGWPSINPVRARPGDVVTMTISLQNKASGGNRASTFVASAIDAAGATIEISRQPDQVFGAWQTRRYRLTWTVPISSASGSDTPVATLLFQALAPDGGEYTRRQAALPIVDDDDVPAATPTPAPPAATATPISGAGGGYPFAIVGSATFVGNMQAALELMRAESPGDYATVAATVTRIEESQQSYSWGGSRAIQIDTRYSAWRTYAGSLVLHEATHVKNWFANDFPVFGCDGEAKSLRAQAAYLRTVGDDASADYIRGLIGVWC